MNVQIQVREESKFNSNILTTKNAVLEYSCLVWDDKNGVLFDKSGKTALDKLSKELSFEAEGSYNVSLDITAVINGKVFPFVNESEYSTIKSTILEGMPDVSFEGKTKFDAKDGEVITMYLLNEEFANQYILDNFGKITVDLDSAILDINRQELNAKLDELGLKVSKREKLSEIYSSQKETDIYNYMNDEMLYGELVALLKMYEATGISNLSDFRKKIYTSLKSTVDNMVILKSKLGYFSKSAKG